MSQPSTTLADYLPAFARPDRLRFAKVPRNFKGAVPTPQLKAAMERAVQ